jgi:glycosyltransferase involved in cell wall biosynthesis
MLVSVVIPCYNEDQTIEQVVRQVLSINIGFRKEIIVIDDCSSDKSPEILAKLLSDGHIDQLKLFSRNTGKGAALREGFKLATGDIVIIQDADLECDPNEYPTLLKPIIENAADVVYGSRFLHQSPRLVQSYRRTAANKFLTGLSNILTDLTLTDMETCYKIFNSDILKKIELVEDRFGFEPEFTAKISRLNLRIAEVAISYDPRTQEQGKKIGFKDGIRAIYAIFKYNLWAK